MAKGSNNLAGRRSSSRNAKPYDANNSFVKKVANKVTDFIPQRSWISKWFNNPQDNGDILNDNENTEDVEVEEEIQKPPPFKRPRIRMDVTHPPGTFTIHPKNKNVLNADESSKDEYSARNDMAEDAVETTVAGPSGMGRLVSSTPAIQTNMRSVALQRSDLNSLVSAENNGTTNGTDDNSESSESTSGCSSLIPQTNRQEVPSNISYSSPFTNRKRFVEDKLNFTNHLQSPRSLFLDSSSRDSLSTRRPSFNASMMTNTLDRASPLSSPFYSGNITFGGANAAGLFKRNSTLSSSLNETKLRVPKRTNVQVKVSETMEVDSSGMSQTAKKILEALEHFSSPISDAKRIPVKNVNNIGTPSMGKKRSREEMSQPSSRIGLRHLTRELTVPTVPDMLKLRRRQKLQDTTVAARQIVSANSGPPPHSQEYCLRSKNEDSKYRGKLRAKSKTNLEDEETVKAVNLPNIALPLTSLPNFNFTLPQPTPNTEQTSASKDNFKFASPIKLAETSKDLKSINNFSFSNPISAKDKKSLSISSESLSKTSSTENNTTFTKCPPITGQNFIWSGSSTAPKLKEKAKDKDIISSGPKIADELKAGSVMDVLNKTSEKGRSESISQNSTTEGLPKSSDSNITTNNTDVKIIGSSSNAQDNTAVWECTECLIKNSNSVTRCVACKKSRSSCKNNKVLQPSSTLNNISSQSKSVVTDCFGSQFKVHSNKKDTVENWEKQNNTHSAINESKSGVGSEPLEKFKPAKDSWECPGCMLRNAANIITCPCCKASKPSPIKISPKKKVDNTCNFPASSATNIASNVNITENQKSDSAIESTLTSNTLQSTNTSLLEKFKPKADSWECPSCMVRNNDSASVCPCCSAPKPGGSSNITSTKTESAPVLGFDDKFIKPEGSGICDSCMVQNDGKVSECVACSSLKPGAQKPTESSTSPSTGMKFSFGIPTNASEFKFGIDKVNNASKTDNVPSAGGFKFGENKQTSSEPIQFTFGIPKQEEKSTSEVNKAISSSFGNTNAIQGTPTFPETTGQNLKNVDNHQKDNEAEKKILPNFSFEATKNTEPVKPTSEQIANTAQQTTVTSAGFTFGLQKSTETKSETKNEVQKSIFANTAIETAQSNTTDSNITSNSANTNTSASILTTQTTTANVKPLPTFSFGVSNTSVTSSATMSLPAQSSFVFPKPQTTTTQSSTTPAFKQQTPASSSSTFSFGANSSTGATTESAPKSTKSFRSTTTAPIFASTPSSTLLFGNNEVKSTSAFGATEAKTPAFGMTDNKPVVAFGSGENKSSSFAAPDAKISAFGSMEKTNPSPTFATPVPAATPASAAVPAFGQSTGTTPLFGSSATPVFGNTTTPNFNAGSTPSIFPTTKPAEASASNTNLFAFGANRPATQSTGGFSFLGSCGSVPKPQNLFGSNPNTSQPGNLFGGSTFNTPTPAPAPAPATLNTSSSFTFNAPKPDAPAAFGQAATSVPVFGAPQPAPQAQSTSTFSSTPASNAGFNFGSTAPPAPSGGFNFGTPATASAPSAGFNFTAPNSTSTVAFDPNTRPSFNFTQGSAPTAFNAQPQTTPPRKIKKAIRRIRQI